MSNVVELLQVTKTYGVGTAAVEALRGVGLMVEQGEFAVLAGPSGSGKTTLLHLIGVLDRPTSGTVKVDGRDTSVLGATALSRLRRDRVGFIFQSHNLLPVLTAFENAEYILMLQGVAPAGRRDRINGLFRSLGLDGLQHRYPRELSGGQQQRVAIARAIAARPALVLADEPTASVDSKTAEALLDLMVTLNEAEGVTFLFSTHDPAVILRAKRVIHIADGKVQ